MFVVRFGTGVPVLRQSPNCQGTYFYLQAAWAPPDTAAPGTCPNAALLFADPSRDLFPQSFSQRFLKKLG